MTKRNDISVPQGYFQDLEKRLGQIPQEKARVTTFQKVSPWFAYAASLAILAAVGGFVFRKAAAPLQEDYSWDYVSYLSRSLDPDGIIELEETEEPSEEDILNYLLADNSISVELIAEANYEKNY